MLEETNGICSSLRDLDSESCITGIKCAAGFTDSMGVTKLPRRSVMGGIALRKFGGHLPAVDLWVAVGQA